MKVFIAGSVHVNGIDHSMVAQDYREHLARIVQKYGGDAIDPMDGVGLKNVPAEQAARLIKSVLETVDSCGLVVAYLPVPSMGAAIEMYHAFRRSIPVVTISPLAHRWTLQALSSRVYDSIDEFQAEVADAGDLSAYVARVGSGSAGAST